MLLSNLKTICSQSFLPYICAGKNHHATEVLKRTLCLLIACLAATLMCVTLRAQQRQVYCCDYVDEAPVFPGGDRALMTFVSRTIHYPPNARECRVEGRVICSFVVETDGRLENIKVIRGVSCDLDDEAVRVIRKMPRWTPARHQGSAVPVYYILPIPFSLSSSAR